MRFGGFDLRVANDFKLRGTVLVHLHGVGGRTVPTLPSLCIETRAKTKKVVSIESWLSSFHIFVGIYTKRFPHEAPALMKYCKTIQDLAGRGHNWKEDPPFSSPLGSDS